VWWIVARAKPSVHLHHHHHQRRHRLHQNIGNVHLLHLLRFILHPLLHHLRFILHPLHHLHLLWQHPLPLLGFLLLLPQLPVPMERKLNARTRITLTAMAWSIVVLVLAPTNARSTASLAVPFAVSLSLHFCSLGIERVTIYDSISNSFLKYVIPSNSSFRNIVPFVTSFYAEFLAYFIYVKFFKTSFFDF
jgi:hypothetical protein